MLDVGRWALGVGRLLPPTSQPLNISTLQPLNLLQLRFDHFANELVKRSGWLPTQRFLDLIGATNKPRRFGVPIKRRMMFHKFLPRKVDRGEGRLDKFAHGMRLTGSHYVIVRDTVL